MAEMVRHKILFPGRDCILELLAAVSGISCELKMASKHVTFSDRLLFCFGFLFPFPIKCITAAEILFPGFA